MLCELVRAFSSGATLCLPAPLRGHRSGEVGGGGVADFTGGLARVKGAFGVGFADDGLAAVTLDP